MTTLKELRALAVTASTYSRGSHHLSIIILHGLLDLVEQAKTAIGHYQHADGASLPAGEWLKQLKEFEAQS